MSPIRLRYLVKDPTTVHVSPGGAMRLLPGEWRRVWAHHWLSYRGEKKIVSGRTEIAHMRARRGWE